jgi:hypothetical protein
MQMLSQEKVKELLSYNPDTGNFTWRQDGVNQYMVAGRIAGTRSGNGYLYISIDGVKIPAHRLVWLYEYGHMPDQIDHINHVTDDNRLVNLRGVDSAENGKNKRMLSNNTSGVTGVHFSNIRKKWIAKIKLNRKVISLGSYTDFNAARMTRWLAERAYDFHKNHGRVLP